MATHGARFEVRRIQKTVQNRDYVVHGVNADLIDWLRTSKFAQDTLGEAHVGEAEIFPALGSRTENEVVDASKKVIHRLWHAHAPLGPYPFLEQLSRFEFDRQFYPDYRDHVSHQLKVYLLGLFTYDSCPRLKDALNASFAVPATDAHAAFRKRWLVTSVYHDIGYVLENEQANGANGSGWQKTRDTLQAALATPLAGLPALRGQLSHDVESSIRNKHKVYRLEVPAPEDIERHHPPCQRDVRQLPLEI